ncbi:unnamed protein product [Durusdinium trenchii]|uniref:Ion transport domain-containing protein n=2 Tax=Durusdinium trenchii TaxID=1381693 RepID=A0ABP0LV51_9DINO
MAGRSTADEVDDLVQEINQHPASNPTSKTAPASQETQSLRALADTQRFLVENQELCSKLVSKLSSLVPEALRDWEAMIQENQILRQKLQANKIPFDDLPDVKPEKFTLPGASEPNCSFSTSELMTVSGSHFRSGRRKSALGSMPKKRKSSLGEAAEDPALMLEQLERALQVSPTNLAGQGQVRPTTPQSKDMAEITEEKLEERHKREQQKKDMEKIKHWSAKKMSRSKSTDHLSSASTTDLGELTLDQQVEAEGKVFGSPEALKDEVRKALHKEEFSLAKYYKTTGIVQRVARSHLFEVFTLALIGVNCLWMSVDADLNTETLLPNALPIFQVAENLFCFGFTLELSIRFFALKHKRKCLKDPWFIFDLVLVVLMIIEVWGVYVVMLVGGESVSVFQNATILRILRVLRLLRTARMGKILRTMPELMLLIKGIYVATRSVFFTLALLGIFIYVFSIIFMQLTRDSVWLKNEYFNGFGDTMLTLLLDAVLPDLSGFIRNLAEHGGDTGWLIATLMMFFVLLGSVTVMNMLVGVLVEVIKTVSEIEREQLEVSFVKKIFSDMITKMNLDADGDNRISKEEFDTLLSKPEAAKALMNIGVDVVGLVDYRDVLFGNEGSMELSFAEFMEAILELRGTNNAKVKDIVDLRKFVSQETGAIYELVATVTNQDDESSLASSSRSRSRSHSKHGQERYEERLSSKIAEEC